MSELQKIEQLLSRYIQVTKGTRSPDTWKKISQYWSAIGMLIAKVESLKHLEPQMKQLQLYLHSYHTSAVISQHIFHSLIEKKLAEYNVEKEQEEATLSFEDVLQTLITDINSQSAYFFTRQMKSLREQETKDNRPNPSATSTDNTPKEESIISSPRVESPIITSEETVSEVKKTKRITPSERRKLNKSEIRKKKLIQLDAIPEELDTSPKDNHQRNISDTLEPLLKFGSLRPFRKNASVKKSKSNDTVETLVDIRNSKDDESEEVVAVPSSASDHDEENISFEFDPSDPECPIIRSATLPEIINFLTSPDTVPDLEFRRQFFMTCSSVCSSEELLDVAKAHLEKTKDTTEDIYNQIILRIVIAMKDWIEYNPHEFMEGESLRNLTEQFAAEYIAPFNERAAIILTSSFPSSAERLCTENIQNVEAFHTPSEDIQFENLTAEEFAQTVTVMTSKIIHRVTPKELLNKNWTREQRHELSPNIMKIIEQFNHITELVISEILKPLQTKHRSRILTHCIEIARLFRDYNNFHGLMAMLGALQSCPVKRLYQTWAEVSEEDKNYIDELMDLMSYLGSYKKYRETLDTLGRMKPVIPFIGVFLTDIIYTEDGNASFVSPGKLNCKKLRMLGAAIQHIYGVRSNYPFQAYSEIEKWFENYEVLGEEKAYSLSTKLEPRDKSEALESLLLAEANLQKSLEEIAVKNEALLIREKEYMKTIELLSKQLHAAQTSSRNEPVENISDLQIV